MQRYGEDDGIEQFYKNYKCLHILDKFSNFVLPELIPWKSRAKCIDFLDMEIGEG